MATEVTSFQLLSTVTLWHYFISFSVFFFYLLIWERGRGSRGETEKHRFVVPLTYALTVCFLPVPWAEMEPVTLAYQDDALTNWAPGQGSLLYFWSKCDLTKRLLLPNNLGTRRKVLTDLTAPYLEALMEGKSCYSSHSTGTSDGWVSIWGQRSVSQLRIEFHVTEDSRQGWHTDIPEATRLLSP